MGDACCSCVGVLGADLLNLTHKQRCEFSGFQSLLDLDLFIQTKKNKKKVSHFLVPPGYFLLYFCCPDHIPV